MVQFQHFGKECFCGLECRKQECYSQISILCTSPSVQIEELYIKITLRIKCSTEKPQYIYLVWVKQIGSYPKFMVPIRSDTMGLATKHISIPSHDLLLSNRQHNANHPCTGSECCKCDIKHNVKLNIKHSCELHPSSTSQAQSNPVLPAPAPKRHLLASQHYEAGGSLLTIHMQVALHLLVVCILQDLLATLA